MSALTRSANAWLAGNRQAVTASVTVVDGGVAVARRTGVAHHISDAAEIALGGETTLAAHWLCGGKSVDAVILDDDAEVRCVACRLAAAVPQCPVVYFAWGEDADHLLYVGSSVKVAQRIRGHHASTPWWSEVRRLTFIECASELEARRTEAESIATRPGVHNRQGRTDKSPSLSLLSIEFGESS